LQNLQLVQGLVCVQCVSGLSVMLHLALCLLIPLQLYQEVQGAQQQTARQLTDWCPGRWNACVQCLLGL